MNQDINYWIARCASLEQELDMMKEQSIVKWHTGEPKDYDIYIVSVSNGEKDGVTVLSWDNKQKKFIYMDRFPNLEATAWCKLSDIEPYKEETK